MANTVSVDSKTIKTILSRLDQLSKDIAVIKERLIDDEPDYGSDAWWEKEIKAGEADIKAGRYTEIRTEEELQVFLDSLKK